MATKLYSRRVLTDDGLVPATVTCRDGMIVSIEADPHPDASDLGDRIMMPGIVDTHVHVNEPGRTEWEGWETATAAAALGGVTTLADMPLNSIPVTTSLDALVKKQASMTGKLFIDCALWGGVIPGNAPELPDMVAAGVRGFKAFLCPSGIDEFPQSEAGDLRIAMPVLRALGVPLLAHAELELPLAETVSGALSDADATLYSTYLHSRPPEWEDAAVAMLVDLCRETGCAVHVVHLSSAGALASVRAAKREGLPFTAETCPHYLCLRAEDVPAGATEFKCAPPIREGTNREALWQALADGTLDFVVTDHSPCIPGLKLPEEGDFMRAWGGIASLQLGLASVYTEAHRRGFSVQQVSRWMTQGPARLLGWTRSAMRVGARADIVVWNPDEPWTVNPDKLAHRHPVTPYAGQRFSGRVTDVWLRGRQIVSDGDLLSARHGELWRHP